MTSGLNDLYASCIFFPQELFLRETFQTSLNVLECSNIGWNSPKNTNTSQNSLENSTTDGDLLENTNNFNIMEYGYLIIRQLIGALHLVLE
jgi:hypothetical protein